MMNAYRKSNPKKCIIFGCADTTSKRHTFPKNDPVLFKKWVSKIKNPILNTLDFAEIYKKNYVVCDAHFADYHKVPGTKRGLRKDAFPQRNLPWISSDDDDDDNDTPHLSHDDDDDDDEINLNMPPIQCCIKSCYGSKEKKHKFPNPTKYLSTFNEWVKRTGNEELLLKTQSQIYCGKRICSKHFKAPGCFGSNGKLKQDGFVMPTLFLPNYDDNNVPIDHNDLELIDDNDDDEDSIENTDNIDAEMREENETDSISGAKTTVLEDIKVNRSSELSPEKGQNLYKQLTEMRKTMESLKQKRALATIKRKFYDEEEANLNTKLNKLALNLNEVKRRYYLESQIGNSNKKTNVKRIKLG